MAGSNWFVCETLTGDRASYMESYVRLRAACLDLGATDAEMRAVFHDNARRVYGLGPAMPGSPPKKAKLGA